jgi:DNA repair photolyase
MMAHSHGRVKTYTEWCRPKIVANACELLAKELKRLKSKPDYVHLCLSTDPFMNGYPEVSEMSLKLISFINSYGIQCSVLSKGALPVALADSEQFSEDNIYGISLVSLDEGFRERWEPGAVAYADRINALRVLHECGCHTYVHIEPFHTQNIIRQNLEDILQAVAFADSIFFSGWNYNETVRNFPAYKRFYSEQTSIVSRFCSMHNISFSTGT